MGLPSQAASPKAAAAAAAAYRWTRAEVANDQ